MNTIKVPSITNDESENINEKISLAFPWEKTNSIWALSESMVQIKDSMNACKYITTIAAINEELLSFVPILRAYGFW
jgi:hypothetical protein